MNDQITTIIINQDGNGYGEVLIQGLNGFTKVVDFTADTDEYAFLDIVDDDEISFVVMSFDLLNDDEKLFVAAGVPLEYTLLLDDFSLKLGDKVLIGKLNLDNLTTKEIHPVFSKEDGELKIMFI